MYTLAVEIHGFAQLQRLSPDLTDDVRRQCIAAIEIQGGTFLFADGDLHLFRFRNRRPEDHNAVVECLEQVIGILKGRERDLSGWTVYADYLQAADDEVAEIVADRLSLVSEDDCAWLGSDAVSLVGHFLQLEEVSFGSRLYHRVLRSEANVLPRGTVEQLAELPAAVDAILEALDPNELDSGAVLAYGDDTLVSRISSTAAVTTLAGEAVNVGWLEFEPSQDDSGYGPLISCLTEMHLHETRFWLSESEQAVWDERIAMCQYLIHPMPNLCAADRLAVDFLSALELYILAFTRRAESALAAPVLLCHDVHSWPSTSVDALGNLLARFEDSRGQRAPLVLLTSTSSTVPSALRRLVRARVRLPRLTMMQAREVADSIAGPDRGSVNWERLARFTGSRSDTVLHYLNHVAYWDRATESELVDLTPSDLAMKVVQGLDRDVQESLLAITLAGALLRTDDLLEMLTELGVDRVRVTAIISRLVSLGVVNARARVTPRFPDLRSRLEMEMGDSARTVIDRVARYCDRLVTEGRMLINEELLGFFHALDEGSHIPEFYHRLVSRLLDERQLGQAHRLLYDEVPTNGFTDRSRTCMQAVLYTNRLRLALLQANTQEAERVRAVAERIEADEVCEFVAADLVLERARLGARVDGGRETLALIKRAIIMYQDREEAAGLARANLDFGLILLAQEDVIEAREYFQIASKMAAASGNLFEQVRAELLQMTSTFIDGNYSRVLRQTEALMERTSRAAMREVQLFAEFVAARAQFELGRYEEAAAAFDQGRSRARFYGWRAPGDLFRRWLARSLVYDNRGRRGIAMLEDEPEGREASFFLGEAWLRAADHGKALAAIDRALELPPSGRGSVEAISWDTGYAGLEDRAIGYFDATRVIDHQLLAFRGYVLAESGRLDEGVAEMHHLTRELGLSEIDPFNRIYYYLYSLILPESGDLSVEDRGTVLGRAVRYIQERTSRLDEYAHKTDFLRRHYWNQRLMSHAQSRNLV